MAHPCRPDSPVHRAHGTLLFGALCPGDSRGCVWASELSASSTGQPACGAWGGRGLLAACGSPQAWPAERGAKGFGGGRLEGWEPSPEVVESMEAKEHPASPWGFPSGLPRVHSRGGLCCRTGSSINSENGASRKCLRWWTPPTPPPPDKAASSGLAGPAQCPRLQPLIKGCREQRWGSLRGVACDCLSVTPS